MLQYKKIVFIFCFLFSLLTLMAADKLPHSVDIAQLPSHPRLLLLKGEEKAIQKSIGHDSAKIKIHQTILQKSNLLLEVPPVRYEKVGRRLLDVSRESLLRIFYLSYSYRMTGDVRYCARAEKEMLAVSDFPDWNPGHFLDVAEMTLGMAIGYDWLYDKLPTVSRKKIAQAIRAYFF